MDFKDVLNNMETVNEEVGPGWIKVTDYEDAPYAVYGAIQAILDEGEIVDDFEGEEMYQQIADKLATNFHIDMSWEQVKAYIVDCIGESKKQVKEVNTRKAVYDFYWDAIEDGFDEQAAKEKTAKKFNIAVGDFDDWIKPTDGDEIY